MGVAANGIVRTAQFAGGHVLGLTATAGSRVCKAAAFVTSIGVAGIFLTQPMMMNSSICKIDSGDLPGYCKPVSIPIGILATLGFYLAHKGCQQLSKASHKYAHDAFLGKTSNKILPV